MKNIHGFLFVVSLIANINALSAQSLSYLEHIELGTVHWLRSFDSATAESSKNDKPILILFQEVPGCGTCTNYGKNILSHPLIVETIETYFTPLCIHNNKGGMDKKILEKFSEPTWNNPVVRITDEQGKDIVARLGNNYSMLGLIQALMSGITSSNQIIPQYLSLLANELSAEKKETAYLSMYCFWTGEKNIAQIPGVIGTEAGFMHGHEVVKTTYNPDLIKLNALEQAAKKVGSADKVFTVEEKYRSDKEVKYYLQKSKYKSVPMFGMQEMKVNADLGKGLNPDHWLSPRQLALLSKQTKNNFIGKDFIKSWKQVL